MLEAAKNEPSTWMRDFRTYPLGPSLGQCCGGTARVLFEHFGVEEFATLAGGDTASASGLLIRPIASGEPLRHFSNRLETHDLPLNVARAATDMLSGAKPRRALLIPARKGAPAYFIEPAGGDAKPLYIYGAGHVGRAIVKAVEDLDFAVNWIDTHTDRFPDPTPEGVTPILARDPADVARSTPAGAFHLVLTYSHPLDLTICHALLGKPDFGFLGLIGSKSKRARFRKRLSEGGISDTALARMTCPIGIGALRGKEPATIAISVAAQLIERLEAERHNTSLRKEGEHGTVGRLSA
jgi:xanthine dehydrogenase accessory factor